MPCPRTQQANLPACSPQPPLNAERQAGKLQIPFFKVFWYDSTRGMNPRSTDCEADALTTTPSRRCLPLQDVASSRGHHCNATAGIRLQSGLKRVHSVWRLVTSIILIATERRRRSIYKARCCWQLSACGLWLELLRLLHN